MAANNRALFIVFFIYIVNSIFCLTSNEIRKIKKYVRRANKGYLLDFGRVVNFIKKEPNLRTKLKLAKWLSRIIKYRLFNDMMKDISRQVLEEYVKDRFFYLARDRRLCMSTQQIDRAGFYYDKRYDILFVDFYGQGNIQCKSKKVYIMDFLINVFYDSYRNLIALAYFYKGVIYLYMNGKIYKTRYTSISNMFFKEEYNRYVFLFKDRRGSGVNINGVEYRLGRRECNALYANDDLSKWAVTCRSKRYKNGVFIIYKNYRRFVFSRISNVYFSDNGIFYTGYNDVIRFVNGIVGHFSVVINSKIHKRYRAIYSVSFSTPYYGSKGRKERWLYIFLGRLIDTDNKIKAKLYSDYSYVVEPSKKFVYYVASIEGGLFGLFRNKKLLYTFSEPLASLFFITLPKKKYVILSAFNGANITYLFFLGKKRIKRYKLRSFFVTTQYPIFNKGRYFLYLKGVDNDNYNRCVEIDVSNFLWMKRLKTTGGCASEEGSSNKFSITYEGGIQYVTKGDFFKRRRRNISSVEHFLFRKNVLFLIGNVYENSYTAIINVSLQDEVEAVLRFNYYTFYFNKDNGKIFFVNSNVLYEVSLNELVDKFLYKISIFCGLQKRLCRF